MQCLRTTSAILTGAHSYFLVSSFKCDGKNSRHDLYISLMIIDCESHCSKKKKWKMSSPTRNELKLCWTGCKSNDVMFITCHQLQPPPGCGAYCFQQVSIWGPSHRSKTVSSNAKEMHCQPAQQTVKQQPNHA